MEILSVYDSAFKPYGRVVEGYGKYSGMDRYEARKAIVADLEEQGYLVKVEPHQHRRRGVPAARGSAAQRAERRENRRRAVRRNAL